VSFFFILFFQEQIFIILNNFRYDRRSYGRGQNDFERNNDKENQPNRNSGGNDRNNRIVNRFQSMGSGSSGNGQPQHNEKEQRGNDRYNNYNNSDYHNNHHGNHNNHYNNNSRRRGGDEEPEWFSGGPTSQHDTIELRGFDDPINDEDSDKGSNKKRNDDSLSDDMPLAQDNRRSTNNNAEKIEKANNDSDGKNDLIDMGSDKVSKEDTGGMKNENDNEDGHNPTAVNHNSPPPARSTPSKLNDNNNNDKLEDHQRKKQRADGADDMEDDKLTENHNDFIEEFLKMDSISELLVVSVSGLFFLLNAYV
jgi:hypothetical protein